MLCCGGSGGVAIAALGLHQAGAATLHIASELPFWMSFQLSPEAVLYAVVLSVFAAAIVGIVPALQATRRGYKPASGLPGRVACGSERPGQS